MDTNIPASIIQVYEWKGYEYAYHNNQWLRIVLPINYRIKITMPQYLIDTTISAVIINGYEYLCYNN